MKAIKLKLVPILVLTILSKSFALPVPSYISTTGLAAYYGFNGNANDESGHGIHGTSFGATLTSDRFGNANSAYLFNGTTNYIRLGNAFDCQQRTINIWVDSYTIDYSQRHIYVSDNPHLTYGFTQLRNELMNGQMVAVTNACNGAFAGSHPMNTNTWSMLTISVSTTLVKHYFNGVLFHTSPVGNIASSVGYNLALLGTSRLFDRNFSGKLDDLGIWTRALSDYEVLNLYNNSSLGIAEKNEESQLSIYPNPASEYVNITRLSKTAGKINIGNAQGQNVYSGELNTGNTRIPTENLPNGIYWVQWIDGERLYSEKLLVSKK